MSVVQITKIFGKGGKLLSEANKTENKKVKLLQKKVRSDIINYGN